MELNVVECMVGLKTSRKLLTCETCMAKKVACKLPLNHLRLPNNLVAGLPNFKMGKAGLFKAGNPH